MLRVIKQYGVSILLLIVAIFCIFNIGQNIQDAFTVITNSLAIFLAIFYFVNFERDIIIKIKSFVLNIRWPFRGKSKKILTNVLNFIVKKRWDIISYLFIFLLLIITLGQFSYLERFINLSWISTYQAIITVLTILSGGLTFWHNRKRVEKEIENEQIDEQRIEDKRKKKFLQKFSKIYSLLKTNKKIATFLKYFFLFSIFFIISNEYLNILSNYFKVFLYTISTASGLLLLKVKKIKPLDNATKNNIFILFLILSSLLVLLYFIYFFLNVSNEIVINPHIAVIDNNFYSDIYQVLYIFENFFYNISNGNSILSGNDFSVNNYNHYYALWQMPLTIIYALLRTLFNQILSFNLLLISLLVATFLSGYLFLKDYFSKKYAILGSLLYLILPYFIGQLAVGHIGAFYYFLFPLIFKSIRNNNFITKTKYSIILGISFLIISLTEWHLSYFIILILGIHIIINILNNKKWLKTIKLLPAIILIILFLISFFYIFHVKNVNIDNTNITQHPKIEQTIKYTPTLGNLINKTNISTDLGSTEKLVYLGPLFIFLIIGIAYSKKEPSFKIISILFLWNTFGVKIYPSLYKIFFDYFPFFSFNRSPSRFFMIIAPLIIFYILVAVKKLNKKIYIIPIFIFFIIPLLLIPLQKNNLNKICLEINNNLKYTNNMYRIIIIPILDVNNYRNSYYLNLFTCSNKPLINGYTGIKTKEIDEIFKKTLDLNIAIFNQNSLNFLKENDVKYIIFDRNNNLINEEEWLKNMKNMKINFSNNFIFIEL
jgi:hypothetical protein